MKVHNKGFFDKNVFRVQIAVYVENNVWGFIYAFGENIFLNVFESGVYRFLPMNSI